MAWADRGDRSALVVAAVFSLTFLALAARYADFVLDDAFITYRFSQNLAGGRGIVWNVSEDPVEGYTSLLWVVVNAAAIAGGADPVAFSKVLSALSGLACIWILAFACRGRHWALAAIAVGALGTSPVFAFLSMQGMETTVTALLLLATAWCSLRIVRQPTARAIAAWFALAFLAALSRPDSLPFTAAVGLGLASTLAVRREIVALRSLLVVGAVFALLAAAYTAWRLFTFGDWFPTPYYIKLGAEGGLFKNSGRVYVQSYLREILFPYLVLFAALSVVGFRRRRLLDTAPVLLGCAAFLSMLLTIVPLQGHLWRFAFPVQPALLLALAAGSSDARWPRTGRWVTPASALMVVAFAGWSLRTLPEADRAAEYRSSRDRVLAGRALAGIPATMYTQASGALPFYSGWRSADNLGLTSPEIARRGVSRATLAKLDPDLVILRSDLHGRYRPRRESLLIVDRHLADRGFVAVAAIRRSLGFSLLYFARRDSAHFDEIAGRLRRIGGADYADLEAAIPEGTLPVLPAPASLPPVAAPPEATGGPRR